MKQGVTCTFVLFYITTDNEITLNKPFRKIHARASLFIVAFLWEEKTWKVYWVVEGIYFRIRMSFIARYVYTYEEFVFVTEASAVQQNDSDRTKHNYLLLIRLFS